MRILTLLPLIALAACSAEPAGTTDSGSERAALIAQRQEFANRTSEFNIAKFDCPAERASDQLVETSLLLWVNERPDLVERSELENISNQFVDVFVQCGASESQVANELATSDDTMMQGFVMAVLKKGRGLS